MRIKEIYCKLPTEKTYNLQVETSDDAEKILQQIKVVLGTKPGDVLGSHNFGINLNQYLFTYNYSEEQIQYLINVALATHVRFDTNKWSVNALVSFGHNRNDCYEYAVIDIIINEQKCLGILVNQN